jgi:spermidine/putrescine transport system permease protein
MTARAEDPRARQVGARGGAIGGWLRDTRESQVMVAQLAPITIFLGLFLVAPLAIFFVYSLWRTENFAIVHDWGLGAYRSVISDPVDRKLISNTLQIAMEASLCTIVIAYGFAHVIRFHLRRWQEPLLFLVLIALFSGYLVRIYAWRTILGDNGIINNTLHRLGIVDEPLTFLLYSRPAAIIVLTNFLVPLAILPVYAALQGVKDSEIEAARDLGCRPSQALWRVTLPLAWRGIFAAWALSFIIAAGDYVTPQLVGGTSGTMIGRIVADAFGASFDWSRGAALSFVTLAVVLVVTIAVRRVGDWVLR